ncbi:uncharacterized protein [Halyomorpha halys]|uniref:uncharacterized protein isoform X2 n=1 Tax=Halyomorpha halys TaxID=286706 RepID=UPI0034D2EBA4
MVSVHGEMWAAVTRSLEIFVAFFEYYAASTTGSGGSKSPGGTTPGTSGPDHKTPPPAHKALHNVKGDHPSMAFLQSRSISLVDMYIDNSEPSENVGQIHFSLEYDFQNTTLILRILTVSDIIIKFIIIVVILYCFSIFTYYS